MTTPDLDRYIISVRTTARMLIEHRDRMARLAADTRAAARAAGHDIDTRIQYAEGSAAAYSVAGAILAGAIGAASVQELAGEGWTPPREPLPPMLPDDASQVGDDRIARAAVRVAGDGTIVDETRPEPHGPITDFLDRVVERQQQYGFCDYCGDSGHPGSDHDE